MPAGESGTVEEIRMVSFFGHRHANTPRFSIWLNRDGARDLVYEDYDWAEAKEFFYNSVVENPPPDPATGIAGAASGQLFIRSGDVIEWECEMVNTHSEPLTFGDGVYTKEMCNVFGTLAPLTFGAPAFLLGRSSDVQMTTTTLRGARRQGRARPLPATRLLPRRDGVGLGAAVARTRCRRPLEAPRPGGTWRCSQWRAAWASGGTVLLRRRAASMDRSGGGSTSWPRHGSPRPVTGAWPLIMDHAADAPGRAVSLDEWIALPEDEPGEVVDGMLVEEEVPDAVHELAVSWLIHVFRAWLAGKGFVFGSELKLLLAPRRGRKPDVTVFLPGSPAPSRRGGVKQPPDIVIEVVSASPRDERRDRVEKMDDYAVFGVAYYWILDPALGSLEIFELGDGRYARAAAAIGSVLAPIPGCPGLRLDLDALWADLGRLAADEDEQR